MIISSYFACVCVCVLVVVVCYLIWFAILQHDVLALRAVSKRHMQAQNHNKHAHTHTHKYAAHFGATKIQPVF